MSTHNIPFSFLKKKIALNYPKSAAMGFSQGTQKRVRNSHGKRAISVRAIEVLLYLRSTGGAMVLGKLPVLGRPEFE